MSQISTKVRTPDGKKVIKTFKGRLDEGEAAEQARNFLRDQRDAINEMLDADEDFVIEVSAVSPADEVSTNGNGDITFQAA